MVFLSLLLILFEDLEYVMHQRLDNLEPCLYYLNLAMYLMHGSLYPGQQTNVIHVHGC